MSLSHPIMDISRLWVMGMLLNAIYFSIFVPLSIGGVSTLPENFERPFLVQASVDAARIIGLPSSRSAKAYARRVQAPDLILAQLYPQPEALTWRRYFYKKYFH